MDQNAVFDLGRKLAEAVLSDEWKAAVILAADLQAAFAEPQPIASYTPWNGITR